MGFKQDGDERKFIGFMISRIAKDQMLGDKVLHVDSIYAYQTVPEELMFRGFKVLNDFAKKEGCSAIQTLTESDKIVSLASRFKFTTRSYLIKEVE